MRKCKKRKKLGKYGLARSQGIRLEPQYLLTNHIWSHEDIEGRRVFNGWSDVEKMLELMGRFGIHCWIVDGETWERID